MKRQTILLLFITTHILSCKSREENFTTPKLRPNKIVLISTNAPEKFIHYTIQDSIGKKIIDSSGSYTVSTRNGFTYLDYMNNLKRWSPKPNTRDTIEIEYYSEYLELFTLNFFTSLEDSFLIKNGDTVIFTYENLIPTGKIVNRRVNHEELNYSRYRLQKLFDDKYTSHSMIQKGLFFLKENKTFQQKSIEYYYQSKNDYINEMKLLDSLRNTNLISATTFHYRKNALNMLLEKNKRHKNIRKWLKKGSFSREKEALEEIVSFDLSHTDSLMKFKYFRDYLKSISQYDLEIIEENNGNYGRLFIDSRIRFDSILKDSRFNQTAKNYLLFDAFKSIAISFRVKDKEKYFKKLQEHTTNRETLEDIKKRYKLNFSSSDQLILSDLNHDTLNYSNVIENNKGKWLYIDFWASWCKPCIEVIPQSNALKKEFENKNIEFIYIALNDRKESWKKAIETNSIDKNQNYFIENGNTSRIIEDLNIKTIPHYLIYNPQGELINGFAKRPGKGAKEQLEKLISKK